MKSLLTLILILVLVFFLVREVPRTVGPKRDVNPGWAVLRHDGPWYGQRHFTEP